MLDVGRVYGRQSEVKDKRGKEVSLKFLANHPFLEELDVSNVIFFEGEALSSVPSLTSLTARHTGYESILPWFESHASLQSATSSATQCLIASCLPNLAVLDLSGADIPSLAPLVGMGSLKSLLLSGTRIRGDLEEEEGKEGGEECVFEPLGRMRGLEVLDLGWQSGLTSLACLLPLKSGLLSLSLCGCVNVGDWAWGDVGALTGLLDLNLGSTSFPNTALLDDLTRLRILRLDGTLLGSLGGLGGSRELAFLSLNGAEYPEAELAALMVETPGLQVLSTPTPVFSLAPETQPTTGGL